MHAIIRQGDGKYYVSYVFGYYRNVTATDDYKSYIEGIHNPYYIVWDENKEKLIKCFAMKPNTKYLITQVLIVDSDKQNWIENDEDGCVDFLNKSLIVSLVENGFQDDELLKKCKDVDRDYKYEEYPEIKDEKDIKDLYWATDCFNNARITKEIMQDDGTLYLRFDGVCGCEVEVWFWGDVEYDTSSRDPEVYSPYWYGSTVIMENGFIYFVDDEDMTVDEISNDYCYFKARHMKYHIIPN